MLCRYSSIKKKSKQEKILRFIFLLREYNRKD